MMTLVGSKKMVVYDDVSLDEKIRIHDKGIVEIDELLDSTESFAHFKFQTRTGDIVTPRVQFAEPLREEVRHFIDCAQSGKQPITNGANGLRVVKILEAAQNSLEADGRLIKIS